MDETEVNKFRMDKFHALDPRRSSHNRSLRGRLYILTVLCHRLKRGGEVRQAESAFAFGLR